MASFEKAHLKLAILEGGWAHHKSDPGGATNYGISIRFLKLLGDSDGDGWLDGDLDRDGDVDIDDVRNMTPEQAKQLYNDNFWNRYKYSLIEDQRLADKLLCLSVHTGPGRAHRILQEALSVNAEIKIDGIIGPNTRTIANSIDPQWTRIEIAQKAAKFYRSLEAANADLGTFIKGWLNRAYYE